MTTTHALPTDLQNLLDRDRIRDRIDRLARGEDRREADLITASFWPDAEVDFGIFQGSFDEYLAWVVPGSPAISATQHFLGQSLIELRGAVALVETQAQSYHRIDMGEGERDIVLGGRYLDRMAKRGDDWRIAHRTMLYDWYQDFGTSIDWSKGVMGAPFSSEHFAGRAVGDYSKTFFGE